MSKRKYLASFIGAHMPHYLSDIRVRLYEALSVLETDDLLIDLGDSWHFNQVVYSHQIGSKHLGKEIPVALEDSTERYNRILSDSNLSLCPEGAGVNTLRFWESIAVGSVPVLFSRSLKFPESFDSRLSELCLFWTEPDYGPKFYNWLKMISDEELEQRSSALRKIYEEIESLTCF